MPILPSDTVRFLLSGMMDDWPNADDAITMATTRFSQTFGPETLVSQTDANLVWQSTMHDLGDGYTLKDGQGDVLVPAMVDLPNGRFTLSHDPGSVFLTATSFDVYAAAAFLLNAKAAEYAGDIQSFSGQAGSYAFAGKAASYRAMADAYSNLSWVGAGREMIDSGFIIREDIPL